MVRSRITAAIALGANVGVPERTFKRALSLLERDGDIQILRRSRWHGTGAVGGPAEQPDYTNGAVLVETTIATAALLERLHGIEAHLGRDRAREEPRGPRVLDLDLLYALDEEGATITEGGPELRLPHPRMEERPFVLGPLKEIAADQRLPRSGRTVTEQLAFLEAGGGLARLDSPVEARAWCDAARAAGASIGFVPTMGALHEGHLELVRRAAMENDLACVSVFVNPLQFNDATDLEKYPRDFAGDAALLAQVGCAMVFTGSLEAFFPGELVEGELPATSRVAPGPSAAGLEGDFRPGHFDGVATIVDRLFDVVEPNRAYFGAKDFQQCLVVQHVAARRGGQPEIVRCPTVREAAGVAMSSRNALLDGASRSRAEVLSRALFATKAAWAAGERDAAALSRLLREGVSMPGIEVEYAEVRDPEVWTANAPEGAMERAVGLVAVNVGGVRLIDNMEFDEGTR